MYRAGTPANIGDLSCMNVRGEEEEGDGPSEKSVEKGGDKVAGGTL